jgi:hypothetical protein
MPTVDTVVADKRQRKKQIEALYLRTKEFLKSPEWQERRDNVLAQISVALAQYRLGMDAASAVYILGQIRQIMSEIQSITDVVVEFDALKAELERYDERTPS